jgi:hypothetical protein
MRPWLRAQGGVMLELIRGKWSWASMARVLTAAGITYRTRVIPPFLTGFDRRIHAASFSF